MSLVKRSLEIEILCFSFVKNTQKQVNSAPFYLKHILFCYVQMLHLFSGLITVTGNIDLEITPSCFILNITYL